MNRMLSILLFVSLSIWFGSAVYFTVFAANELFHALSVDQAGAAVGALFPTFFGLSSGLALMSFACLWLLGRRTRARGLRYRLSLSLTGVAALLSMLNQFWALPRIEAVERRMGPISAASGPLLNQFRMLHGISMTVELAVLLAALTVWLLIGWSVRWMWMEKETI